MQILKKDFKVNMESSLGNKCQKQLDVQTGLYLGLSELYCTIQDKVS